MTQFSRASVCHEQLPLTAGMRAPLLWTLPHDHSSGLEHASKAGVKLWSPADGVYWEKVEPLGDGLVEGTEVTADMFMKGN